MDSPLLYGIISIFLSSLISLIGIVTISIKDDLLEKITHLLVSFSAGALIGGAILHLIPEAVEKVGSMTISISIHFISGLVVFFIIEKLVHWRHCHLPISKTHKHHIGAMNLIGDAVHNLIDGMIIGASYLVSIPTGISATVAVLFHEIPQEIGDFGTLIYSGYSKKKALLMNFFVSLAGFIGLLLAYLLGTNFSGFLDFLIPFTAGGFIYIATADLMPELNKECGLEKSISQLIMLLLGVIAMAALLAI